jgi:predicted permease
MGILDLKTGKLQFANAGHNPPLLKRSNGEFEYLRTRAGFVLAGMDGVRYKAGEITLNKGDRIFLYTDGVTEASNKELAMFGEEALAYYKLFCLPLMLLIYTWGISVLTPKGEGKGSPLKRLLNAPTIAMVAGIIVGLSGAGAHMPDFFASAMDSLKACMGPVAMLIAGATIAKYNFAQMLKNKKVYIATGLRLTVLPALLIGVLFGIKVLCGSALNISMTNDMLFFCLFATGAPLGLNTVVFPEAYGGDPKTGASMALISHALCVISIPIMYSVMVALFGAPFGG